MRSLTRVARLTSVFPAHSSRQMHAWLARLCVLMEDSRIELHCLYDDPISASTQVEPNVRKLYFLRRIVATLVEFAEVVRLLEEDADFRGVKTRFDSEAQNLWSEAVAFFHSNESFLKKVRNDVGGHFGGQAAVWAVENLQRDAVAKMEIIQTKPGAWAERLHFTGLIAATALLRHLPGRSQEEKVEYLCTKVVDAAKHATEAVHVVTAVYLWHRFGRG